MKKTKKKQKGCNKKKKNLFDTQKLDDIGKDFADMAGFKPNPKDPFRQ